MITFKLLSTLLSSPHQLRNTNVAKCVTKGMVRRMVTLIRNDWKYGHSRTVFENHRKSLIQHSEQSELRLQSG